MKHTVIGMDIAKRVFQLHAVDPQTGEIERVKLRRDAVLSFFARRTRSLVAIEACGSAHYWARELRAVRGKSVFEDHLRRWLSTFWALPPHRAAAATAVVMVETTSVGPPRPQPKYFHADHPFLFVIRHNATGAILFVGVVNS